ncbi:MAG: aspartate aminotransferase-like enzyme [Hyphomicrobiaceae bacterium]|jgi:aspartate aminotransferase-like enzyme
MSNAPSVAELPTVDPDGLLEYSVVFTDRSLNHMSKLFQGVMCDISETLGQVYNASSMAIVPGGGTYGMEAVARQLGTDKSCMVLRNGWFSYRWSQIFEMGSIPAKETVLKARRVAGDNQAAYEPMPLDEVVAKIHEEKPDIFFAPHVETAAGMILPDDYLKAVGAAMHDVGGLFVLDCIASGTIWVDMEACNVDVLISAPQKGWSASPCGAFVMMSEQARNRVAGSKTTSFAVDLKKWAEIMDAYTSGGHAYHATMPTDALVSFHKTMKETEGYGFDKLKAQQAELGQKVRALLASKGFRSLAAEGFAAPGVVVCYTSDPEIQNSKKFAGEGLQTAAGVPLMVGEPDDFSTFRLGLFGLDKLQNIDRTVERLDKALDAIA